MANTGYIATEKEAYAIGKTGYPTSNKYCTKTMAVALGCKIAGTYNTKTDSNGNTCTPLVCKNDLSTNTLYYVGYVNRHYAMTEEFVYLSPENYSAGFIIDSNRQNLYSEPSNMSPKFSLSNSITTPTLTSTSWVTVGDILNGLSVDYSQSISKVLSIGGNENVKLCNESISFELENMNDIILQDNLFYLNLNDQTYLTDDNGDYYYKITSDYSDYLYGIIDRNVSSKMNGGYTTDCPYTSNISRFNSVSVMIDSQSIMLFIVGTKWQLDPEYVNTSLFNVEEVEVWYNDSYYGMSIYRIMYRIYNKIPFAEQAYIRFKNTESSSPRTYVLNDSLTDYSIYIWDNTYYVNEKTKVTFTPTYSDSNRFYMTIKN